MPRPVELGDLAEAKTSLFLDGIDQFLQANGYISQGEPFGHLPTTEYRRDGEDNAGRAPWKPGSDHVTNLDVATSLASGEPVAKKLTGGDHPEQLFIIAEKNERYLGATGNPNQTLLALSRLTIGLSARAADKAGGVVRPIFVTESNKHNVYDEEPKDTAETMLTYDRLPVTSLRGDASGLSKALTQIGEEELSPDKDACVVVSDFITGSLRTDNGELIGFDWEYPLREIHDSLKDRLYVVRLTTPAHTVPPVAQYFETPGGATEIDEVDYRKFVERYSSAGQEKADRISKVLQTIRHIELGSQEPRPLLVTANFIYGEAT